MQPAHKQKLIALAKALIDHDAARVVVEPQQRSTGFWFGGGNMAQAADGSLYLVGRYRNHGDSRTGLGAGERGLKLAIFRSTDDGQTFEKALSWSKPELNVGDREVLSIEGSALRIDANGAELFVSTEKSGIGYPSEIADYLKPGTGVWTIERLAASSVEELKNATPETVLECRDPRFIHVKDPFLYEPPNGDLMLLFCSHPFCWSSSNTGYATRAADADVFAEPVCDFFRRGFTWDVAMTRGTAVVDVPAIGAFADQPPVSLVFYDGGECLRNMDEHSSAVTRPRGYSCEELGGLAMITNSDPHTIERLSITESLFVSPQGTGCNRYVDVLTTASGMYATWQQSHDDLSQPLMLNSLTMDEVEEILK